MSDEDDSLDSDWQEPDHPVTADELREIIDEHKELISRSAPAQWVLTIIGIWIILAGASWAWHSKLRYFVWYGSDWDAVTVDKKPHDCDWLTAPLGDKNCHYDAQVQVQQTTISVDKNSGRRIVSYDDGKTWNFDDDANPAKAGKTVNVGWQRVDE